MIRSIIRTSLLASPLLISLPSLAMNPLAPCAEAEVIPADWLMTGTAPLYALDGSTFRDLPGDSLPASSTFKTEAQIFAGTYPGFPGEMYFYKLAGEERYINVQHATCIVAADDSAAENNWGAAENSNEEAASSQGTGNDYWDNWNVR